MVNLLDYVRDYVPGRDDMIVDQHDDQYDGKLMITLHPGMLIRAIMSSMISVNVDKRERGICIYGMKMPFYQSLMLYMN